MFAVVAGFIIKLYWVIFIYFFHFLNRYTNNNRRKLWEIAYFFIEKRHWRSPKSPPNKSSADRENTGLALFLKDYHSIYVSVSNQGRSDHFGFLCVLLASNRPTFSFECLRRRGSEDEAPPSPSCTALPLHLVQQQVHTHTWVEVQ